LPPVTLNISAKSAWKYPGLPPERTDGEHGAVLEIDDREAPSMTSVPLYDARSSCRSRLQVWRSMIGFS